MNNKTTKKDYAAPWSLIANGWKLFTPPWRPSKVNIAIYEKILKKTIKGVKNLKALILGATPEIRDMLAKYKNIEVVVSDYNMEMVLAMNELVTKKNFQNERWIKTSWVDMPLEKGYFDIVFGDYVISQLPENLTDKFIGHIKSLLKKNGLFVTRAVYYNPEIAIDFFDLMERFKNITPNNQTISDLAAYVCFEKKSCIKRGNLFAFQLPILKKLRDAYEKKYGKDDWIIGLDRVFSPYTKEWFFYDLKSTEKNIRKYFDIENKAEEPKISSLKDVTFTYTLSPKK